MQGQPEEIGEILKDRVVRAWTWGLGVFLGSLSKPGLGMPVHRSPPSQWFQALWRGGASGSCGAPQHTQASLPPVPATLPAGEDRV